MEVEEAAISQETEEEPLDLLACRNQLGRILKKLDYATYGRMEETCSRLKEVCTSSGIKAEHEVYQIRVDTYNIWLDSRSESEIEGDESPEWGEIGENARMTADLVLVLTLLDSFMVQKLMKMFTENGTKASKLRCEGYISCSPGELENLLGILGATFLDCQHHLDSAFFDHPTIGNMDLNIMKCNFEDQQLLSLNGETLFLRNDNISAEGVNQFLQQWKAGHRKIKEFDLEFEGSVGSRDFDAVLQGLDANPIWTPALHDHSIVRDIPLDQFPEMLTDDPQHLYSLWRSYNIGEILILRLNHSRVEISLAESEKEFLSGYAAEYTYRMGRASPMEVEEMEEFEPGEDDEEDEEEGMGRRRYLDHDLLFVPVLFIVGIYLSNPMSP